MIDPSLMPLPKLPSPAIFDPGRFGAGWSAKQAEEYATAYGLQCYQLAMERAAQACLYPQQMEFASGYLATAIRALALQNPALERMARIDDELGEQP